MKKKNGGQKENEAFLKNRNANSGAVYRFFYNQISVLFFIYKQSFYVRQGPQFFVGLFFL